MIRPGETTRGLAGTLRVSAGSVTRPASLPGRTGVNGTASVASGRDQVGGTVRPRAER